MSNASSRAWTWRHAFASSDLPATTKHVLHTLGMFMNELGEGCYPSVADICRYSGLDKKTVLKHLAAARDAGWIAVSQHGYRGQKWKRNEYAARWPERDVVSSCPPADNDEGGGAAPPPSEAAEVVESGPQGGGTEGSKVVEEVHQDKTSPVTPPDTSPVERERASADEDGEEETGNAGEPDRASGGQPAPPEGQRMAASDAAREAVDAEERPETAAFQKRVMRFCNGRGFAAGAWEDWDTSSPGWVVRCFAKLTVAERGEAERWRDAYLTDLRRRKKRPVPVANFIRDRLWTGLDPALLEQAEKARVAALPAAQQPRPEGWASFLGPVGMAWLFAKLAAGPADGELAGRAFLTEPRLRQAWPAAWWWQAILRQKGGAALDPEWHGLKDAMEPVPQASDRLAEWREAFRRWGWPWLASFDRADVVYCPRGGPEGLEAFAAKVARVAKTGNGQCDEAAE